MSGPRISIIVPVRNGRSFLEEALRTVIDQDYPNLELIVIDGGSSDGSVDIIRRHADRIDRWTTGPDDGQADAIMRGMVLASGDLVNWLNADDLLAPSGMATLAAAAGPGPWGPTVYVGGATKVDRDGQNIHDSPHVLVHRSILPDSPPIAGGVQASTFLTRSAWTLVNGIDPSLHYAMDIDLYLKCAEAAIPFVPIGQRLASCRVHADSKTMAAWSSSVAEKRAVYEQRLQELTRRDQRTHRRRVNRLLASQCLEPIQPNTSIRERVSRVGRAVCEQPDLVARPRELRRLIRLLRTGSS